MAEGPLPERAVVLTFDDGYRSVFDRALPLLKRFGFSAAVYVVSGFSLQGKIPHGDLLLDEEPLGPDELAALASEGWTVGSHSVNHPRLSSCWPEIAMDEFVKSRESLAPVAGRQIDHFSVPHGSWSPELVERAQEAGYRSVATSREGANKVGDNPWSLRRMEITPWDTLTIFRHKIDGWYDWLGMFKGS